MRIWSACLKLFIMIRKNKFQMLPWCWTWKVINERQRIFVATDVTAKELKHANLARGIFICQYFEALVTRVYFWGFLRFWGNGFLKPLVTYCDCYLLLPAKRRKVLLLKLKKAFLATEIKKLTKSFASIDCNLDKGFK